MNISHTVRKKCKFSHKMLYSLFFLFFNISSVKFQTHNRPVWACNFKISKAVGKVVFNIYIKKIVTRVFCRQLVPLSLLWQLSEFLCYYAGFDKIAIQPQSLLFPLDCPISNQNFYYVTSQYIPIRSPQNASLRSLDEALTWVECFSYTKYWSLTSCIETIFTHYNLMLFQYHKKNNNASEIKILLN